ncbi:hypothetical protein AB4299_12545 [Vibrio cyclitrophicus]
MNLKSESMKISKSTFELERRRLNWKLVVKDKVASHFEEFAASAKNSGYPFLLTCRVNEVYENLESIQITSESNYTGITKSLDNGGSKHDFETGAGLVFSLTPQGNVAIQIRPYRSEWLSRTEENIVIKHDLSPDDITENLIRKYLRIFLLYIRASSVYGTYGTKKYEYYRVKYFSFFDIRNWKEILNLCISTFNQWALMFISALLGVILAKFY